MQAAREYDIMSVRLHGANVGRNFPDVLPQLVPVDSGVAIAWEMREVREAHERLEAYMAELRAACARSASRRSAGCTRSRRPTLRPVQVEET